MIQAIEKTCKAHECGKKYMGSYASKFCSDECRKKGVFKPDPKYTLIKKETKKETLSLPVGQPITMIKSNQPDLIQDAKNLLVRSVTLDQILRNIAKRHKYKNPKSFVSHIEDMLILCTEGSLDGSQN